MKYPNLPAPGTGSRPLKHCALLLLLCIFGNGLSAQTTVWPEFFVVSAGSSGTPTPLRTQTADRIQSLYSPVHFHAATSAKKLRPGYIRSVYLQCFWYSDTVTFSDFTIRLGHTEQHIMTSGPFIQGLTTVLEAPLYTINKTGYNSWVEIPLQTPFFYDGVRNLVIETGHEGMAPGSKTTGFEWLVENPGRSLSLLRSPGQSGTGTHSPNQYVIGFDIDSRTHNAGVLELAGQSFCSGTRTVHARIINNGMNAIDSVQINWSVDGQSRPALTWRGRLDTLGSTAGNTASAELGAVHVGTAPVSLKIWTSSPNGQPDPVPEDDTLTYVVRPALEGIFTVGGLNPDYLSFTDAVHALNASGICGPVTFLIRPGVYGGRAELNRVRGSSAANRITFAAESGRAADVRILDTATSDPELDYVFRLTETPYVTLKNLSFEDTGNRGYGRVLAIRGKAEGDSILNCVFRPQTVTTGTVSVGSSGNTRTALSANGIIGGDIVIRGNHFLNGAFGISISGGSAVSEYIGNILISGNRFEKIYGCGIDLFRATDVAIRDNTITDGEAVPASNNMYGISVSGIRNDLDISGNSLILSGNANAYGIRIANYNVLSGQGQCHGNHITLLDGTNNNHGIILSSVNTAQDNERFLVRNNLVRVTGNGIGRGISISGGGNTDLINNTFYTENGDPARIGHTFHLQNNTSTVGLRMRNNIIANAGRYGYAMHVNVPLAYDGDYNNIYSNAGGYITTGTNNNNRDTFRTLTEWRDTSRAERNSISYRPGLNAADLRPDPADSASWSIHGRGIHWPGNDRDIAGSARSTLPAQGVPDLGAYEFTPSSLPPAAQATPGLAVPGASQTFTFGEDTVAVLHCHAGTSVPGTLIVRQYSGRAASLLPHDSMYFYTDLGTTGSYGFDISLYYKDPWTGTMPSEDRITLAQGEGTGVWTDYTALGHTDTLRNILTAENLTTLNLFTGTNALCLGSPAAPEMGSGSYIYAVCSGSELHLSANARDQQSGISWQWEENRYPTGPWQPGGGTGARTLHYHTGPLSDTTWLRVTAVCAGSGLSSSSAAIMIPVSDPRPANAMAAVICGTSEAHLDAQSPEGHYLGWYDAPTGGRLLDTGSHFHTGLIDSDSIFWVGSSTGPAYHAGKKIPNDASAGAVTEGMGMVFEADEPLSLESVEVFPASFSAGSLRVTLSDTEGHTLRTAGPFTLPAGTGSSVLTGAAPVRIALGFRDLPRGKYLLAASGISSPIIRDGTGSMSYPLAIGTEGRILHATDAAGNILLSAWNYFYNWQIASGCSAPRTEVRVEVAAAPEPEISGSGSALATGSYAAYQWQLNGEDIPGANGQTFPPAVQGNYTVRVTDSNGCEGISPIYPYALGIAATTGNQASVYPNPTRGMVFIRADQPVSLLLTDISGRVLQSLKQAASIDMSGYTEGIYFLQLSDEATGRILSREKLYKTTSTY